MGPSSCLLLVVLSLVSFLSRLASATNAVHLINNCPYPMYFWNVGPGTVEDDLAYTVVPGGGGSIIHSMIPAGGMNLKIRDLPHYRVAPQGIIQVEYNLEPDHIWWDLSAIDCAPHGNPADPWMCPFIDGGIRMWANDDSGKVASCLGRQCTEAYQEHGSWHGEPSWRTVPGRDLFFETCVVRSDGPRTLENEQNVPPYPPPPSPTPLTTPPTPLPPVCPIPAPSTYPTPSNYPAGTTCLNANCTCYSTTQPWLWPKFFPLNTPSCPGQYHISDRETYLCEMERICGHDDDEDDNDDDE